MLATAREHYGRSVLTAQRAAREAERVKNRGLVTVARVVTVHQAAQAQQSEAAVAAMLSEQDVTTPTAQSLNALAFTTSSGTLGRMLDAAGNAGFVRLVESLVQSSGRAAESVSAATRNIGHVRMLQAPSCSRCAVLAGRIYRYSEGFLRHPNCDCVMVPTRDAGMAQDPAELARQGLVRGLSKADERAIRDGADMSQVVNIRRSSAGLEESGRVLLRAGRPTPEGIYRMASDHAEAVSLLARFGYIR